MSRQSKMSSSYSKSAYFSGNSIVVPNGPNIPLIAGGGGGDLPPVDVLLATSTANQQQIYNDDPTEANWGVWEVQADEATRSNLVFYNLPAKTAPNPLIPADDVEQYYFIDRQVTIAPGLTIDLPADTLISGQSPLVFTVTDYKDATFELAIPKAGVNFGTDYNTNIIQATFNALDAGGVLRGYMKFYDRPFTFTSTKWFNSVANPGTSLAGQPGPSFAAVNQVLPYDSYAPTAIGLLITSLFPGGVTSGQVAELTIGPISAAPFFAPSHEFFQPNDILQITTSTNPDYPTGWFLYLANIQSVDGAGNSTWAAFTQDPSGAAGATIGVPNGSAPVDLATVQFDVTRSGLGLGGGTGAIPTTMPILSTVFNLDGVTDTIEMTGGPYTTQQNAIEDVDDANNRLTMEFPWGTGAQTALDLEPDVNVDFTYAGTIPRSIWISPSIGPAGTSQEPELDGNLSELFRTRQVYVPPTP